MRDLNNGDVYKE